MEQPEAMQVDGTAVTEQVGKEYMSLLCSQSLDWLIDGVSEWSIDGVSVRSIDWLIGKISICGFFYPWFYCFLRQAPMVSRAATPPSGSVMKEEPNVITVSCGRSFRRITFRLSFFSMIFSFDCHFLHDFSPVDIYFWRFCLLHCRTQ